MKVKVLKIIFWTLITLGVIVVAAGIAIPLFFSSAVDEGLRDLWLSPHDADKWAYVPGDNDIKIVRTYKIFHFNNSNDFFSGQMQKVEELYPITFREYSNMSNWSYENEAGKDFGNKTAEDYVAFNMATNLISIPSNTTVVPPETQVTSVMFTTYIAFYGLTHSPAPFYMISALYEAVIALETDFYVMILVYCAFAKYLSDSAYTAGYLNSMGFPASLIMNDAVYGWSNWKTLKPWVESLLDYNKTGTYNSFENIQMHFQIDGLINLIQHGSLLYELIETIQVDMLSRYGTNNATELGLLQWSKGAVTLNLPLDLGTLQITGASPFPSFIMLNSTFSTFPEIYFLQVAMGATALDFSKNASTLLQISNIYPRDNTQSLLFLNNLGLIYTNTTLAALSLDISEPMVNYLQAYLFTLVNFPVPDYDVKVDGYTMFLTKASVKSLVSNTVKLRNDAYWSVPTLLVFARMKEMGINCKNWGDAVDVDLTSICGSAYGWDTENVKTWMNLQIWVKAAYKNSKSVEYSQLVSSNLITAEMLNLLFYDPMSGFNDTVIEALQETALNYKCAKEICNYEELFQMQWSTSAVTLNPPLPVLTLVAKSNTMQSWVTSGYSLPIEWLYYSHVQINPSLLTYDQFLNPGIVRIFYNKYFQGDFSYIITKMGLPNDIYIEAVYQYLIKIIPGLSFFRTMSQKEWISGYYDPFQAFAASLGIYGGGIPTLVPFGRLGSNSSEDGLPKHVVNSGRVDTELTKSYVKYFGSSTIRQYSKSYNELFNPPLNYSYKDIWPVPIHLNGGDGGSFGTQVSDDAELEVFISSILRSVNLTYEKSLDYHELGLSRFLPKKGLMNTSASVPENADYYQLPNGYDGFLNMSSQFGAPIFIGFPHCYKCSNEALQMIDYYVYTQNHSLDTKINPSYSDTPYADIEPLTGSGIRVYLAFEVKAAFYNDYFFKGIYEPVPGKGVYLPMYTFIRKSALTASQVNKFFGNLLFVEKLRKILFYCGVIAGSAFIIFALIVGAFIYRMNKFDSWRSPKNTMIKRLITVREEPEMRVVT